MAMYENRFTERAQTAIRLAHEAAADLGHGYVGSEHLLIGLAAEKEGIAAQALRSLGVEAESLKNKAIEMVGKGESGNTPVQGLTPRTKAVIEKAFIEAARMSHNYVGTEHLLMGVLYESDSIAARLLIAMGVQLKKLYQEILSMIGVEPTAAASGSGDSAAPSTQNRPLNPNRHPETKILNQFSRDLTDMAKEGRLDPIIGRDNEITRIIQILSRRTKNNPVLIGEPGVGKTAIAEGLAQKIISDQVPDTLRDKRVVSLDLSGMVAGTKYRGEFEERIKAAMEEIRKARNIVLFIDELHTIIGAGAAEGAIDAANILKPALSRGEIQVVGATTLDEYRKHVEKDAALERRFQPVQVGEPTPQEAVAILKGLRDRYEAHHKVTISDDAIQAAVDMSVRYLSDRFLPDKAIDLIDEACSRLRLAALTPPPDLKDLEEAIKRIGQEKEEAIHAQDFELAAQLRDEEKALKVRIEGDRARWESSESQRTGMVHESDVAHIVSGWTGIPVTRLTEGEAERLLAMDKTLHERLVGQNDAVDAVTRAIKRGRVGLKDPKRPVGSFLFLGPTGVGKTELCRALAEALFGSESAMLRVDMSEYMEKHTVSKIIGSPPGYIGHDDGGQLTERVRRKPYSVVLFDEIEKAHPDVFNILLQILEDGVLTDSHGRKIDFKNTIIVMTSNVGARNITDRKQLGFSAAEADAPMSQKEIKGEVMSELKRAFRPEFLNRIDEIIVFHQLDRADIRQVAHKMMKLVEARVQVLGVTLTLSEAALDWLADKGYDPVYGARPLRRTIQTSVEDVLAEKVLLGEIAAGQTVMVDVADDALSFTAE